MSTPSTLCNFGGQVLSFSSYPSSVVYVDFFLVSNIGGFKIVIPLPPIFVVDVLPVLDVIVVVVVEDQEQMRMTRSHSIGKNHQLPPSHRMDTKELNWVTMEMEMGRPPILMDPTECPPTMGPPMGSIILPCPPKLKNLGRHPTTIILPLRCLRPPDLNLTLRSRILVLMRIEITSKQNFPLGDQPHRPISTNNKLEKKTEVYNVCY